jgi:hypothetical protein
MAMATATKERQTSAVENTEVVAEQQVGEDGYPFRLWPVDGHKGPMQKFSLRPYAQDERPIYWNPITTDGHMWWRDYKAGPDGIRRVIVKHRWILPFPGAFSPKNDWENFMVRRWMQGPLASEYGGTVDPDKWQGLDHPENAPGQPPHMWACECSWQTGLWAAMKAHQAKRGSGHEHVKSL